MIKIGRNLCGKPFSHSIKVKILTEMVKKSKVRGCSGLKAFNLCTFAFLCEVFNGDHIVSLFIEIFRYF